MKASIERQSDTPAVPDASLSGRLPIWALAFAVALDWMLSQVLSPHAEVAVGAMLLVMGIIPWIWTPSERRIVQFSYPLGLAGFLILFDHVPRNAQIVGALAIGILLGIGFGLIPWKIPEARPYWRDWTIAAVLIALIPVSTVFGLIQLEAHEYSLAGCLSMLPTALLVTGLMVAFVRAGKRSGILPSTETCDDESSRWLDPTRNMTNFLSSVLFLIVGLSLSIGSHLLYPAFGATGIWILVLAALLTGSALVVNGTWRSASQSWITVGLLWGAVQASTTLVTQPWFDTVRVGSSLILLIGLAMAAFGKDVSRGIIPVRHPQEAMLAVTAPLAVVVVTVTRII